MNAFNSARSGPLVKICGISDPETALVAARAGADFIGLVFYPKSHRYVDPATAKSVAEAARDAAGGGMKVVGLFVNEPVAYMNHLADEIGLDLVQLSGDESPDVTAELNRPAIATIRENHDRTSTTETVDAWRESPAAPFAFIVDAHVPGFYGGTGERSDWLIAETVAAMYRTFLAGGLTPESVRHAIDTVRPYAVDVSSGVETNKKKDHTKIRAFIEAARSASIPH